MKSQHTRIGLILTTLLAALILLPSVVNAQGNTKHELDDALLMMIASQSLIYENYSETSSVRLPGLAAPVKTASAQGASPADINEQKQLAEAYSNLAKSITSNPAVKQHLDNKAKLHSDQAAALARARRAYQRRRNNVFRVLGRKLVNPLIKGSRSAFRGLGRLGRQVLIVAKQEVIDRGRQIIRAKIRDVVDLGRGKLVPVLGRIARKFGLPAAELLREFVVEPVFNRLQNELQRNVEKLTGQLSNQESANRDSGSGEDSGEEEYNPDFSNVDEEGDTDYDDYNPDFSNVDEEGDTDYDDGSSASDPSDSQSEFDEGHVFEVHEWFTANSCRRFNGNIPSWMESTSQTAAPMFEMGTLTCHWTTDQRESGYGCAADGENCPRLPGRIEVEVYALPTIAKAQERFRSYTTDCSQDATCQTGLTELVWQYSEGEPAFADGIAYFTRLVSLNDNVIIELWWGGSEGESDIYALLSTANALIDPLQR